MASRSYSKRDFGQRKRIVSMAITNVQNATAIYEAMKSKTITDPVDAEDLLRKVRTLKEAVDSYEKCVLQQETFIVDLQNECKSKKESFDEEWENQFKIIHKDFEKYKTDAQECVIEAMPYLSEYMKKSSTSADVSILSESRVENKTRKFTNILAPDKLEHNASVQVFNVFETKFKAHYDINDLDSYRLFEQEAFLVNLLDDALANKIKVHFKNQLVYTIFPNKDQPLAPSIMGFLRNHFEIQDPLMIRRFTYFSGKQRSNESDLHYFERIKQLESEAEAKKLTPDETFLTILMNGCTNVDLKRQVLKLGQRPDLEEVETLFRQYEEVNVMNRAIRPHSTTNHEISEPENQQLSNYRKNIDNKLTGKEVSVRGFTQRGRGGFSNRGRKIPQPQRTNQGQHLYCRIRKQNGKLCNYLPFWNCYSHSRMDQAQKSKLDSQNAKTLKALVENNELEETTELSVYDIAQKDNSVWQEPEFNRLTDEEIVEVPAVIQQLNNGDEIPNQFYEPRVPSSCPRIYVMIANAIDGQPLYFKRCIALPDSGCQLPVIDEWLAEKLKLQVYPNVPNDAPHSMIGATGNTIAVTGKAMVFVEFCGHPTMFDVLVVRGLKERCQLYLGWREMVDLNIVPPTYPAPLNLCDYEFPRPQTIAGANNGDVTYTEEVNNALKNQVYDAMYRYDRMKTPVQNGANCARHFRETNSKVEDVIDGTLNLTTSSEENDPPQEGYKIDYDRNKSQLDRILKQRFKPLKKQNTETQCEDISKEQNDENNNSVQSLEIKTSIRNLMAQYDDVFDIKNMKSLKGPSMRIVLRDDVPIVPNYVNGSRATPYNLLSEANKELKSYLESKIIKAIKPGERTRWLNAAMFLPKPNGGVRLVVDLRILNSMAKRDVHCFNSPIEILKSIPPRMKYFAVIDAYRGYYQCDLHPDDQDLTAFILKDFGTFKFTKIPQGYKSSGDHFCKLSDVVIRDVPNCRKLVDDILIFGETEQELIKNVRILFENCRKYNLTLNPKKTQIGTEVTFGGYVLNQNGIKIDPKRIKAIKEFPPIKNITDVRSFLGLALQFKHHTPELMKHLLPFTALTSTKTTPGTNEESTKEKTKTRPIVWNEHLQQSFEKAKELMTSLEGTIMSHYDGKKPFFIYTDASRDGGLGWCGVQFDGAKMKLVECGSCTISDTAKRAYSVSELEMLAVVTALKKLRMYTVGNRRLTVLTDHKPLIGILSKSIDKLESTRLCRMVEKVSAYNFKIQYVKGKKNEIADALSRHPVDSHDEFATEFETFNVHSVDFNQLSSKQGLLQAIQNDDHYQQIMEFWKSGTNIKNAPPCHPARLFKTIWHEITVEEGMLIHHKKIIIPNNYKQEIMTSIHENHMGFQKCFAMAQEHYYWPTMKNDLRQLIDNCHTCLKHKNLPPPTPPVQTIPKGKMEHFSSDLCEYNGHKYLVQADRFTGYLFVNPMIRTTADRVIAVQQKIFNYFGYPKHIRSDNGPPYNSTEYADFCKRYDIDHQFSDPFHPISNGHAERAVGIGKSIIKKAQNLKILQDLIHQYNNAPLQDGLSPTQWMFGSQQKGKLPILNSKFNNRINDSQYKHHLQRKLQHYKHKKKYASKRTRPLKSLPIGKNILMYDHRQKTFSHEGTIIAKGKTPFSYIIEDTCGKQYTRNRRHLRGIPQPRKS